MQKEIRKLYSIDSVAQALDISRSHVYTLMKSGDIKTVLVGCHRRIPEAEVQRIASEGTSKK
ncbi:MAG: helix-turn-helix domain-containing protein [Candidatus Binatus sp.]|uniref:helix-turn-helix domain-containing protein n=1 Tax=Candidatus Binatus sp. TaxID=2811406 RepID=UPI003C323322